jgi:hypothetical protein
MILLSRASWRKDTILNPRGRNYVWCPCNPRLRHSVRVRYLFGYVVSDDMLMRHGVLQKKILARRLMPSREDRLIRIAL